jgi:transposase
MEQPTTEQLRKLLQEKDAKIAFLIDENARLRAENALLRQKVDLLVRRIFGRSSESVSPDQLELFLSGEDPAQSSEEPQAQEVPDFFDTTERKKTRRGPRGRARWPEDLPVLEEVIEPEEVLANPQDWKQIGQERSERLDYEPARFFRRVVVRNKYVEKAMPEAAPVIAEMPPGLQERCTAAPGLVAQVVVAKYCDHLPLYRQEQIYLRRHGIWLPRQNMAEWVDLAAFWLQPIYEEIKKKVFADGYAQVDETPVNYLGGAQGKAGQGYLWTAFRPGVGAVYQWETSRAAECLDNIIPVDFQGTLQCDGYAGYRAFAATREGIALGGCMAHVRRKISEARDQDPRLAAYLLRQIQLLYRIEERLRVAQAGPAQRAAVRAAESRMIYLRLQRIFQKIQGRYLPQSAMGKAIAYALGQWERIGLWIGDGRMEIDNNLVENAIRPTALGKKNWLFFGDAQAGQRSAIIYTIIENCRLHGIDPFTYLRDVLTRLPSCTNHRVHSLTPEQWKKARADLKEAA